MFLRPKPEPMGAGIAGIRPGRILAACLLALAAGSPTPLPASDLGGHLPAFLRGPLTSDAQPGDDDSDTDTIPRDNSDIDSDVEAGPDAVDLPGAAGLAGQALDVPLVAEFMAAFATYALESHGAGLDPGAPATPLTAPRLRLLKGLRWGCRESLRMEVADRFAPHGAAWQEAGRSQVAFEAHGTSIQTLAAMRQDQALRDRLRAAARTADLPEEALDGFLGLPAEVSALFPAQAPQAGPAEETKDAPPTAAEARPGTHHQGD